MKRLISKVIHRSLNALMGGASLPVQNVMAIEGKKEMVETAKAPGTYSAELPNGKGKIKYRIPNAIEQLRFQAAARWYEKDIAENGSVRTSYAMAAIHPYIESVDGYYTDIDEVIADRDNLDVLIMVTLHIAGTRVPEAEKKQ
jgi:hypothetical protein